MEVFTTIAATIFGFGVGVGTYSLLSKNKDPKSNNEQLNDNTVRYWMEELDVLRHKLNLVESYNAGHVKTISERDREIYELKMKNQILGAFPFHIPLPMWSVDQAHRYDYVNEKYAEIFLKPLNFSAEKAVGLSLMEVWPEAVAKIFMNNNQRVMDEDLIMNDMETVPDGEGHDREWRILKMKRPYPLGVIGIAIPKNGMFDRMLRRVSPATV